MRRHPRHPRHPKDRKRLANALGSPEGHLHFPLNRASRFVYLVDSRFSNKFNVLPRKVIQGHAHITKRTYFEADVEKLKDETIYI